MLPYIKSYLQCIPQHADYCFFTVLLFKLLSSYNIQTAIPQMIIHVNFLTWNTVIAYFLILSCMSFHTLGDYMVLYCSPVYHWHIPHCQQKSKTNYAFSTGELFQTDGRTTRGITLIKPIYCPSQRDSFSYSGLHYLNYASHSLPC